MSRKDKRQWSEGEMVGAEIEEGQGYQYWCDCGAKWQRERKKSFRESKSLPRSQMIRELSYVDAEINNYGKNHVSIHQRSVFQHAKYL